MLSEKDKAVVASMARTGMSLEVLKISFPQFDATDVEEVYKEEQRMAALEDDDAGSINISCNCS